MGSDTKRKFDERLDSTKVPKLASHVVKVVQNKTFTEPLVQSLVVKVDHTIKQQQDSRQDCNYVLEPDEVAQQSDKKSPKKKKKHKKHKSRSRSSSSSKKHKHKHKHKKSSKKETISYGLIKVNKKKLLKIAKANAAAMGTNIILHSATSFIAPSMTKEQPLTKNDLGSSLPPREIKELTEYCRAITQLSDDSMSDDDGINSNRRGLKIKSAIIRDARSDLVKELRDQFPVSNGQKHKEPSDEKQIPLEKEPETNPYLVPKIPQIDVNIIVKERLDAVVRLNANPNDLQAHEKIRECDYKMTQWILTKEISGQFGFNHVRGDQYVTPLGLEPNYNTWLHKDYLKKLAPLSKECIGKLMLEKMGWKDGESLGKRKVGTVNPIAMELKNDRKGLSADFEEKVTNEGILIDGIRYKHHPVTVLTEYCKRKKWPPPEFECISEGGPDHYKTFLIKVNVNNIDYKPSIASLNKKLAKARAAHAALEVLGIKRY